MSEPTYFLVSRSYKHKKHFNPDEVNENVVTLTIETEKPLSGKFFESLEILLQHHTKEEKQ